MTSKYYTQDGRVICQNCGRSFTKIHVHLNDSVGDGCGDIKDLEDYKETYPDAPTRAIDTNSLGSQPVSLLKRYRDSMEVEKEDMIKKLHSRIVEYDALIEESEQAIVESKQSLQERISELEEMLEEAEEMTESQSPDSRKVWNAIEDQMEDIHLDDFEEVETEVEADNVIDKIEGSKGVSVKEYQGRKYFRFPDQVMNSLPWDTGDEVTQTATDRGVLIQQGEDCGKRTYRIQDDQTLSLSKRVSEMVGVSDSHKVRFEAEWVQGDLRLFVVPAEEFAKRQRQNTP